MQLSKQKNWYDWRKCYIRWDWKTKTEHFFSSVICFAFHIGIYANWTSWNGVIRMIWAMKLYSDCMSKVGYIRFKLFDGYSFLSRTKIEIEIDHIQSIKRYSRYGTCLSNISYWHLKKFLLRIHSYHSIYSFLIQTWEFLSKCRLQKHFQQ